MQFLTVHKQLIFKISYRKKNDFASI